MNPDLYKQFQAYYDQYLPKVYNYLFYRTGYNKELAEDLCSSVFLKALEKFPDFAVERASFQTWVYSIAHNLLIDHYRGAKELASLDEAEEAPGIDSAPLAKLQVSEDFHRVLELIGTLPESYREILTLKYIDELDNTEISAITGKSLVAVRVTLHRALSALKNKLP